MSGQNCDILFVNDLHEFQVEEVMTNGNMVAKDHKLTYQLDAPERSSILKGELKCKKTIPADFEYKVEIGHGEAKVLAMDVKGPFVRKEETSY